MKNGVGIFTVVFVVMAFLKLYGVLPISWWLVTAPLYGPFVVLILFLLFFGLTAEVKTEKPESCGGCRCGSCRIPKKPVDSAEK